MRRNCVTTRVRIYYIDGGPRRQGGRGKSGERGKRDDDDMCFLASPGIITLELTADEEGTEKKVGGKEGRKNGWTGSRC